MLRAIKTAFTNLLKETGKEELTEAERISILRKMHKQRIDSADQYDKANRPELESTERLEAAVIEEFLPKAASRDEILEAISIYCTENNFTEDYSFFVPKKSMGDAVKEVKKRLPSADGKMVADIVKEFLV